MLNKLTLNTLAIAISLVFTASAQAGNDRNKNQTETETHRDTIESSNDHGNSGSLTDNQSSNDTGKNGSQSSNDTGRSGSQSSNDTGKNGSQSSNDNGKNGSQGSNDTGRSGSQSSNDNGKNGSQGSNDTGRSGSQSSNDTGRSGNDNGKKSSQTDNQGSSNRANKLSAVMTAGDEAMAQGEVKLEQKISKTELSADVKLPVPSAALALTNVTDAANATLTMTFSDSAGQAYAECSLDLHQNGKAEKRRNSVAATVAEYQLNLSSRKGYLQEKIGVCDTDLATTGIQSGMPLIQTGDNFEITIDSNGAIVGRGNF